jgi:hypothetical protein
MTWSGAARMMKVWPFGVALRRETSNRPKRLWLKTCAVWRFAVSPAQPGLIRKEISGLPDLPGSER